MTEHPILFSVPMVRAILEGRKTMTRRVIKPQPVKNKHDFWELYGAAWSMDYGAVPCMPGHSLSTRNPYGQPGDRLWVRETWANCDGTHYAATDSRPGMNGIPISWRPSIFMPRALSRINLEITAIRVERVQDISEADAKFEGIEWTEYPIASFRMLWDSINAKRGHSWGANPWVWVIEFKVLDKC